MDIGIITLSKGASIKNFIRRRVVSFLAVLGLLTVLFALYYIGHFNNPNGDDFLFGYLAKNSSPGSVAINYFNVWTARLSNMWLTTFGYEVLGLEGVPRYAPLFSFMMIFSSCYMTLYLTSRTLMDRHQKSSEVQATSVMQIVSYSILLFFILLSCSVVPFDNLFWLPGIMTYATPFFLISLSALLFRLSFIRTKFWLFRVAGGFLSIILILGASFMNEALNPQLIILALYLLATAGLFMVYRDMGLLPALRRPFKVPRSLHGSIIKVRGSVAKWAVSWVSVLLLVLSLSSLIMYKAPGTSVRRAEVAVSTGLATGTASVLSDGLAEGVRNMSQFVGRSWFEIFLVLLVGVLFSGIPKFRKIDWGILLGLLAHLSGLVVVLFTANSLLFRSASFSSVTPYALFPSYLMSIMVIIIGMTFFSYRMRLQLGDRSTVRKSHVCAALIIVALFCGNVYGSVLARIKIQDRFTDALRAEVVRQTVGGSRDVVLGESHQVFSYCGVGPSPAAWCNDSMRLWYGIDSITSEKLLVYDEAGEVRRVEK